MAIRRRPPAQLPVPEAADFFTSLQGDPTVKSFEITVNKDSGVIRCNARGFDGRTVTRTFLGPGLEEVVKYDPTNTSVADRNQNIKALLARGLTQTDVATKMGVSQALVSKIHRLG